MHERLWIGFKGFDAWNAAEFHLLSFVNLRVSSLGFTEWLADD